MLNRRIKGLRSYCFILTTNTVTHCKQKWRPHPLSGEPAEGPLHKGFTQSRVERVFMIKRKF